MLDYSVQTEAEKNCVCVEFKPAMRSGVWSDIGPRSVMEDDHVVIDNLIEHLGSVAGQDSGAYYGVSSSTYIPYYIKMLSVSYSQYFECPLVFYIPH